jgi:hypothetical protein
MSESALQGGVYPIWVQADDLGHASVTLKIYVGPSSAVPATPSSTSSAPGRRAVAGAPARRISRHVTFKWPADVVSSIGVTHRRLRRIYGDPNTGGPDGHSRPLSQSALLAAAMVEALRHPTDWLASVRDDGRGRERRVTDSPGSGIRTGKVSVGLAPDVREQWDTFVDQVLDDAEEIWSPGFRPTRQNLALAAVQHELPLAESWLPRRSG